MWWLLMPKWAKAAIFGAVGAGVLIAGALAYVEAERRQAAAQERVRIELEQRRGADRTRAAINQADRSMGDGLADHLWLCGRFDIECVQPGDDAGTPRD